MDRFVEMVLQCVTEIGKCLWAVIQEHSGYIIHHNDNVEKLKKSLEELVAMKEDIEIQQEGKAWIKIRQVWITEVVKMQVEAGKIVKRSEENRKWLFCPDLFWCYSVGREAKEITDKIDEHKKDWKSEARTGNPPPVDASTSAGPVALVKDRTTSSLLLALLDPASIEKLNLSDQNLGNGSIPSFGGLTQPESLDPSRNYELSELPFKKGDSVDLLYLDHFYYCTHGKGTSLAALGELKHYKSELAHLRYLDLNGHVSLSKLSIAFNSTVGST